jgi:hypothetical protein
MAKKPEAKKPAAKSGASKPEQSTAVSTQVKDGQPLVVVTDQVPDYLRGAAESNRVIPRLEVVQALSKAIEPGHQNYIKGAQAGDLINSVTRRNYGKEAFVVNVHYTKQYLVWKDIKKGGGFFGAFPDMEQARDRAKQEGWKGDENDSSGIEIIDTPVHLCLIVDREVGSVDEIMVSLPRTKAKISRQWNSMIKLAGGDRFMRVYRVGSNLEAKGEQKYWNFTIAQSGFPHKVIYERAAKLYEQVKSGKGRTMDTRDFDPGERSHDDKDM